MSCLLCGEGHLEEILNLGESALANKFLSQEELSQESEKNYPLRVGWCKTCSHVQLLDIVPAPEMFDDYLYVSSVSTTLTEHLGSLAEFCVDTLDISQGDFVVDIGSNDGTLLKAFNKLGCNVLGVEPAKNLTKLSHNNGVDSHVGYFDVETAKSILDRYGKASLITSTNSFPHIQDLNEIFTAVDLLLEDSGAFVIEAHYLLELLAQNAFDTVYHEHVSYWTVSAIDNLVKQHKMYISDVYKLPIHHGQIRVILKKYKEGAISSTRVIDALERERILGILDGRAYREFSSKVKSIKTDLNELVGRLKQEGKTIVAYGAPAKGNTLLTYLELNVDDIPYIADKSPLKQGRFTPGKHIPVVSPDRLYDDKPDYIIVLAWNFIDEILEQLDDLRKSGTRFIVPVPEIKII